MSMLKAVQAVQHRHDQIGVLTFFAPSDLWRYYAVFDDRTCSQCEWWQTVHDFTGDVLLEWFPYLEIYDENMIYAHVHNHCRCYLLRVSI